MSFDSNDETQFVYGYAYFDVSAVLIKNRRDEE